MEKRSISDVDFPFFDHKVSVRVREAIWIPLREKPGGKKSRHNVQDIFNYEIKHGTTL